MSLSPQSCIDTTRKPREWEFQCQTKCSMKFSHKLSVSLLRVETRATLETQSSTNQELLSSKPAPLGEGPLLP